MIERDEWLLALSADAALRFFGMPADWPVHMVRHSKDLIDGTCLWKVRAPVKCESIIDNFLASQTIKCGP